MFDSKDINKNDEIDFSWGTKRGRGGQHKDVQFYESFTYDGVEYFLYDSVYLFKEGEAEPYIGKLIKIWELKNKDRKVKILWFFHPSEISNYLEGENVAENELFLASGVGNGLANVNPLEAIAGKCNVVCTSKDDRNRQPSNKEIEMAQYVFYRTFDVQDHTISDKLGEKIAMIDVNFLLNKNSFPLLDLPMAADSGNVPLKLEIDNKGSMSSLDKSAGPDYNGPVVGLERMLIDKDAGAEGDVEYVGSGDEKKSLLLKEDNCSKTKDAAAGHGNLGPVALPAAKLSLASTQKIKSRLPDSKHSDVNEQSVVKPSDHCDTQKYNLCDSVHSLDENMENCGIKSVDSGKNSFDDSVPPVNVAYNRKSKLLKDTHSPIGAIPKVQAEGKLSKKLKIDGTAPLSSNDGSTTTPKLTAVVCKKALQSVGAATESNDRGRLTKESNGLYKKIKSESLTEDKSDNKLDEESVQQLKDKKVSPDVYVAANKAAQPANGNGNGDPDDKDNMSRQMVGTSNDLSKNVKSNCIIEDKIKGKLLKAPIKESKDVKIEASTRAKEVTQRPHDRSKWFTATPWEERMKEAHDQGRLVLLQNLDPTYISSEVEDIIWHGFEESCTAKVLQRTATSNRYPGQALVIFKTREVAEKVARKLDRECLMLPNGRPLVGSREICFPGRHSPFPGHLFIDKLRLQTQREMREAVSTSHSAQPNTLEYEMAIEWRLQQERSELCWKMLYKRQGEEVKKLRASLKSK